MGLNLILINKIFEKIGRQIIRFRWLLLATFLGLIVFSITGLRKLNLDSSNDAWYFKNDKIVVTEERFEKIFGNSDIAVIHLSDDKIMTTANLKTIRHLTEELEHTVPYVDDVLSLTSLEFIKGTDFGIDIGELIPEEIPDDEKQLNQLFNEALRKHSIRDKLISTDGTETFIIVSFNKFPENWKSDMKYRKYIQIKAEKYPQLYSHIQKSQAGAPDQLIGGIINLIANQEKYQSLHPKTSGVYPMTYDKRIFFQTETPRLIKIGLLLSILVLALSLRSVNGVIFPIITTIGGMIITLGIEGHFGVTTQPSLIPFPLFLGLAVSVGYSIHVFNFYNQKMQETENRKEAVIFAVEKTGWPLLFTALTTICALLSFLFLKIKVMTWIGYTTATIIAVTYVLSIVVFPILLSFGKNKEVQSVSHKKEGNFLAEKLSALSYWTMRNPVKILMAYSLFAVISFFGLLQARVDFSSERTMGRRIEYVDRVLTVGESQIGSFNNYSICIEFPQKNQAKNPETLEKLDKFLQEVEAFELTRRTTSILDKLKEVNKVLNEDNDNFYKIPETRPMIAQSLLLYENAGGNQLDKWVNYNYDKLRVRVEISRYKQRELIRENEQIKELGKKYFPKAKICTVGSIAKFCDMSSKVAIGQVKAFSYSLLIIAFLMMVVFGSIRIGLIGIIPNISPALVVGGIMGYFNIPLDMIMSTLMPMLLGLAVDDTIHFINHANYEFQRTNNYNYAVGNTFRTVGKSLLMTSVVMIVNFSAYTTSIANLYINFGILASAGIFAALISDLFVTPVCLKLTHAFGRESVNETTEKMEVLCQ